MSHVTLRQLATILAALSHWRTHECGKDVATHEYDIASDGGRFEPLSAVEIYDLCERLNRPYNPTDDAALRGSDLPTLVRELFTHVDAKGHPQTQAGGIAEYDVLVPVPAALLRRLRAAIAAPVGPGGNLSP